MLWEGAGARLKKFVDALQNSAIFSNMNEQINNQPAPDMTKVAGGWETDMTVPLIGCLYRPKVTEVLPNVYRVDNFLNPNSCDLWIEMVKNAPVQPEGVSIQGMMNPIPENVGSCRITMFNRSMAKELERLFAYVDFRKERVMTDFDSTDFWQGDKNRRRWSFCGVSPLLRTMMYSAGGQHFTHMDAGFQYNNDNYRTLMSFVLYLSTNKSGATRIIDDKQGHLPVWERDHSDWTREAREDEVLFESYPKAGSLLIFDHRIAHDVQKFVPENEGEKRIIVRGDLIFKAV